MSSAMTAAEILEREFLEIRAKLLELASSFDRLDRAAGSVAEDPRVQQIRQALGILRDERPNRAEEIQRLFSLPYDREWRSKFQLASKG